MKTFLERLTPWLVVGTIPALAFVYYISLGQTYGLWYTTPPERHHSVRAFGSLAECEEARAHFEESDWAREHQARVFCLPGMTRP